MKETMGTIDHRDHSGLDNGHRERTSQEENLETAEDALIHQVSQDHL